MMRFCLGIETIQSIVSVICQIIYLLAYNDVNDPLMSVQARLLFGLNIFSSVMTVIISLVMLFFKQVLLKQAKRESTILELQNVYRGSQDFTQMQENPLYDQEGANVGEQRGLEEEIIALKDKNLNLEKENQSIKENCDDMEAQLVDCKAQLANRDAENESLKKQLQDKDYTPISEQTL